MTASLPTVRLGWTDMLLTRVEFGAWAIGGGGWGAARPHAGAAAGRAPGQPASRGGGVAAAAAGGADRPVPDALACRGRHRRGGLLAGVPRSQARGKGPGDRAVEPRHLPARGRR